MKTSWACLGNLKEANAIGGKGEEGREGGLYRSFREEYRSLDFVEREPGSYERV